MTATQAKFEALNIIKNVRWCEMKDGFIDHENRKAALAACIGLINRTGDTRLKSLVMKAFNANNRVMGRV